MEVKLVIWEECEIFLFYVKNIDILVFFKSLVICGIKNFCNIFLRF